MMAETLSSSSIRIHCAVDGDRLSLRPAGEAFEILDTHTGQTLGTVQQAPGSPFEIELFYGKGGFMVTVFSPAGARYFGLPGSEIEVGDVRVALAGEPITSNPNKQANPQRPLQPQSFSNQATILGAGLATRFERISGHTTHCSKPGVPLVGTRTVIECIANTLAEHGFDHLIVNTYFKPESVKSSLSRSQARHIDYIDETEPSGTAGGLRKMLTEPRYAGFLDRNKPLLVVQGDSVTDADFSHLMRAHIEQQALVTIGCQIVAEADVEKFGIIVTDRAGTDGQSGRITGFQEKPPQHLAQSRLGNTGFYIFSPEAYPLVQEIYDALLAQKQAEARSQNQPIPTEVPFDFATDIFPAILQRTQADPSLGKFWAESVEGYWSDIGNPKQYLESVHDIYARKVRLLPPAQPGSHYRDGVIYWEGAQAIADREGAQLSGNVVVALPYQA